MNERPEELGSGEDNFVPNYDYAAEREEMGSPVSETPPSPSPRRKKKSVQEEDQHAKEEKSLYDRVYGDQDMRDVYRALVASVFGEVRSYENEEKKHFDEKVSDRWRDFDAFQSDVNTFLERQKGFWDKLSLPNVSEQQKSLIREEIDHWPKKKKGLQDIAQALFGRDVEVSD